MNKQEIQNYRKAGQIAREIKEYCKKVVKKDILLTELAEKIENRIEEFIKAS